MGLLALLGLVGAANAEKPHEYWITVTVSETCLRGRADAAWATALLAPEGLKPRLVDGAAVLGVCATTGTFGGREFSEAILGLETSTAGAQDTRDGLYMAQALNSLRFFAWVERKRNHSPYRLGDVSHGAAQGAWALRLAVADATVIDVSLSPRPGEAAAAALDAFEGPVYLPGGYHFDASLTGELRSYALTEGSFVYGLAARGADPVSDLLADARFTPTSWSVGTARTHAKDHTVRNRPASREAR